jgi:hypothetical protein
MRGNSFNIFLYFVGWGLFYGVSLSLLSGTLIVPVLGSFFSLIWGIGIGMALGIITGIFVAIAQQLVDVEVEADVILHRRNLSWWVGVFTAIAAPFLVMATSNRLLYISPVILVSVILHSALWGGLAAAHTTSRAVDRFTKGRYALQETSVEITALLWQFRSHILLGIVMGAFGFLLNNAEAVAMPPLEAIHTFIMFFIIGVSVSVIVGVVLTIANALLIQFLNGLVFHEYFPSLPKEIYRRILVVIIAIFNLLTSVPFCVLFSLWYLPPFIALASATAAARYADQHWNTQKKQAPFTPKDEWDDSPFQDDQEVGYAAGVRKAQ